MQCQLPDSLGALLPVALQAVIQVALFTAEPADHIDCCIRVGVEGAFGSLISRRGNLADQAGFRAVGGCTGDRIVHSFIDRHSLCL